MISVSIFRVCKDVRFSADEVKRIVRLVCQKEKVRRAELSFVYTDDKKIKAINKKFLNHATTTDILTFPFEEGTVSAEIYINVKQAQRQAEEYDVTLKNEMTRLVVHGTLHALGYDDIKPLRKKVMFERQERYVAILGHTRRG
ncbi:MAG: rRNA maturation RNase YbeY [Bacteroidota bacterium]|nr:rRNA maturation RNase YbeY [Bacteroidota bacterium]